MTAAKPLNGINVLELGGLAGATAGRVLAGLGATVRRIEPPAEAHPVTARYGWANLDKEIAVLDLEQDGDRVRDLLAGTDILIEDHLPGVMSAYGLDPDRLRQAFPHLVVLSVSHHGQTGPYATYNGSALTSLALGGVLFHGGRPGEPPPPPPFALADAVAGVTAAFAAVAALAARGARGAGDWIDCAVSEAVLATIDWELALAGLAGISDPRAGSGPHAPVFRTGDGYVRVALYTDAQWDSFFRWLDTPAELASPEWRTADHRRRHAQTVENLFRRERGYRDRDEVVATGQDAGVIIAPVYTAEEIAADRHFGERMSLAGTVVPGLGGVRVPRAYARLGSALPDAPAPFRKVRELKPLRRLDDARPPIDFTSLRVVELSLGGVGAVAARHLAFLGADVVKVTSPGLPEDLHGIRGATPGGISHAALSADRNKRTVTLDLEDSAEREQFLDLIERADVLIASDVAPWLRGLGLDEAALRRRNPGLIYAGSEPWGATGPARDWRGFGATNQAPSGLAHLWRHPDDERPDGLGLAYPLQPAGTTLALCIVAALIGRQTTGEAVAIDLAQVEFAMAMAGEAFVELSATGADARRGHRNHPVHAPLGCFPTLRPEEWLAVAVETDEQWLGLRKALGGPEWAADSALATAAGRVEAAEMIHRHLAAWTASLPRPAAFHRLQVHGVPAMPVYAPHEILADPHLNYRQGFDLVTDPGFGALRLDAPPYRFDRLPLAPSIVAHAPGADTDEVLDEWLGLLPPAGVEDAFEPEPAAEPAPRGGAHLAAPVTESPVPAPAPRPVAEPVAVGAGSLHAAELPAFDLASLDRPADTRSAISDIREVLGSQPAAPTPRPAPDASSDELRALLDTILDS